MDIQQPIIIIVELIELLILLNSRNNVRTTFIIYSIQKAQKVCTQKYHKLE